MPRKRKPGKRKPGPSSGAVPVVRQMWVLAYERARERVSVRAAKRSGSLTVPVNRLFFSQEETYEAVHKIPNEMVGRPLQALRAAKNVSNSLTCNSIEVAPAIEWGSVGWLVSSEDMKERVAAFAEKPTTKCQTK